MVGHGTAHTSTQTRIGVAAARQAGDDWHAGDASHCKWVLSSPPFDASSVSDITCQIYGGQGTSTGLQSGTTDFLGIAVTSSTDYITSARRSSTGDGGEAVNLHLASLSGLSGNHYLHLIDDYSGGWGWMVVTQCVFYYS